MVYMQGDGTLLIPSHHPTYGEVQAEVGVFADLVQRLDPMHVYQIRPISLWQAAATGITPRQVLSSLRKYAAHPIPFPLQKMIVDEMSKWGRLILQAGARGRIVLRGPAKDLRAIAALPEIRAWTLEHSADGIVFAESSRAEVKRFLTSAGWPVQDQVGYASAPPLQFDWVPGTTLRDYQCAAMDRLNQGGRYESGVIVLPCGAGKTLVGIGAIRSVGQHALVLTPTHTSAKQWRDEFLSRTTLTDADVRLYDERQPLAPVTITTYQKVAARNRTGSRQHLQRLTRHAFGLVIYDEVHMLPAPLFRLAADLQGIRRLGLTATLVREDGAETDVFSLIGSKLYEASWKQLERAGYLAAVRCVEIRVPMPEDWREQYTVANVRRQHRLAALNPAKHSVVQALLRRHAGEACLIIGHYLEMLEDIAEDVGCPMITGKTPQTERDLWYAQFREGRIRCLVLSRVANMAVDLPNAAVAIQVSGLFGSRQEEAQRLGRLLRPGTKEGVFYSLVSDGTVEMRMAKHRQLYLVEQGYTYDLEDAETVCIGGDGTAPKSAEVARTAT
ncbi:DNA repair helicase XPB [Alicyclobacillus contaminans]|uniref:DNA repair helicase XPB n=1 Tax=Alicyclobacillus contaminans TaxID=392016 RepID=UPI001FDEEB46|nr:DNA repair helicase XPB [Alicyclobacillus contaminans]